MIVPIYSIKQWDGHEINCIIHASIEEVIHKMKVRPRLTFTSPPYGVGKVLSVASQKRVVGKGADPIIYQSYDDHDDSFIPEETYQKWLEQIRSVSGVTFWNVPAKQFERSFGVDPKEALGHIIWSKHNAAPFPRNKIIYFHEYIWVFGDKNLFISPVKSVWTARVVYRSKHPAPFPIDLPAKAIEACTRRGDLVFDPFGGSGSTAAVAKAMGRNFLTCDISKQYCSWMKERIEKTSVVL
jgi:DNA modification methylase